ncbi:hypothetical protein BDZ89DRAFT_695398 [Hymenopellis radicata]|nr:hypothetical protein BDZ89DRAFT_695398 [Hymenopellis radicata]
MTKTKVECLGMLMSVGFGATLLTYCVRALPGVASVSSGTTAPVGAVTAAAAHTGGDPLRGLLDERTPPPPTCRPPRLLGGPSFPKLLRLGEQARKGYRREGQGKGRDMAGSSAETYTSLGLQPTVIGETAAAFRTRMTANQDVFATAMLDCQTLIKTAIEQSKETKDFLTRGLGDARQMQTAATTATSHLAEVVSKTNAALNQSFDTLDAIIERQGIQSGDIDGLRNERDRATQEMQGLLARIASLEVAAPRTPPVLPHPRPVFDSSPSPSKRGRGRNNTRIFNTTHVGPTGGQVPMTAPAASAVPTLAVLFSITRVDQDGPTMVRRVADMAPGLSAGAIASTRATTSPGVFVVRFRTQVAASAFVNAVSGSGGAAQSGISVQFAVAADSFDDLFSSPLPSQGN